MTDQQDTTTDTQDPTPGGTPDTQGDGQQPDQGQPSAPPVDTFDTWLAEQHPEYVESFTAHVAGLKNTIGAVRDERDTYRSELEDLRKSVEGNEEATKKIEALQAKVEESQRKEAFVTEAVKAGVKPKLVNLAWAALQGEDGEKLVDKKGDIDFDAFKEMYSDLFTSTKPAKPPTNGGAGAGQQPQKGEQTMSGWIRDMYQGGG